MKNERTADQILDRIRTISVSYGLPPCSVSAGTLHEYIKSILPGVEKDFTHMVSISLWNQYSREEVIDYLKHSKECLELSSDELRDRFLAQNLDRIYNEVGIENWKMLQSDLILGMVTGCARSFGREPLAIHVGDLLADIKLQLNELYSPEITLQYIVLI